MGFLARQLPLPTIGHHGKECSFDALLKKYKVVNDAALVLPGKIVNSAYTDHTIYHQPSGACSRFQLIRTKHAPGEGAAQPRHPVDFVENNLLATGAK